MLADPEPENPPGDVELGRLGFDGGRGRAIAPVRARVAADTEQVRDAESQSPLLTRKTVVFEGPAVLPCYFIQRAVTRKGM